MQIKPLGRFQQPEILIQFRTFAVSPFQDSFGTNYRYINGDL